MEENRKMTEQEIEDAVKYVTVSFAVEGLTITEEEKENMRKVGRGEHTADEVCSMYLKEYSRPLENREA